jgi:DNA polymerase III epsilon subunit family exonuclease
MNSEEKKPESENLEATGEEPVERVPPDFSRFVAIDLETTGLDPKEGEIIELGAVRYLEGIESEVFHALVKPEKGYPERNRRLTGISPELLATGTDIASALRQFTRFIAEDLLISHNARFDLNFLEFHLQKHGIEPIANPALCTLHLAAFVDPEADSLQLGSLAGLWRIDVVDPHRAVLDARLAGSLALKLMNEIRNWKPEFVAHLTGYRGKSLDSIFDFFDYLIDEPGKYSSWRLDEAIRESLSQSDRRIALQPFPSYEKALSRGAEPDPEMLCEMGEAFKRGGVTILEDIRPGKVTASNAVPVGSDDIPRLVVAVSDETCRRLAVGEDGGTDGLGGPEGAMYLGRLSEYICLERTFGDDGRPDGWLELSPFERIVLARWLAGTRTGRVGRVNWWLLNNFSGLKGHLNSLSESRLGCLGPNIPHQKPCFAEMAKDIASRAGRVVVDHRHLFSPMNPESPSERLLPDLPAVVVECADRLVDGARDAASRMLELEPFTRRVSAFIGDAVSHNYPFSDAIELAASSLKDILDVSRRTLKAVREEGKVEFTGPLHFDEESWSQELFSELASALDACWDGLTRSAEKLRGYDSASREFRLLGDAIRDAAETVKMFRRPPQSWSASLEGAPLRSPRRVSLNVMPVDVRESIRRLVSGTSSGFFATGRHLRLDGSFERLKSLWGIDRDFPISERILEDSSVALPPLFLPEDVMPPSGRSGRKYQWNKYMERTANLLKMLAETLGGHTVAAFSAHHELRRVREILEESPPRGSIVLAQYQDGTKSAIVQEYLNNWATLLLGGRNFLDGVDLRPAGFTVLVVVKLPFTSPEEPLHRTALRMAEADGLDGLRSYLVPLAVETTNRWIDSLVAGPIPDGAKPGRPPGAVVLLDPRAVYNEWGDEFLGGLNAKPVHRLYFREMLARLKETAMSRIP